MDQAIKKQPEGIKPLCAKPPHYGYGHIKKLRMPDEYLGSKNFIQRIRSFSGLSLIQILILNMKSEV